MPLDYVDTRYSPYFMQDSLSQTPASWALNTDVLKFDFDRFMYDSSAGNPRHNDIVLLASAYGGVFRATESGMRVQASTSLPLPGARGSLSGNGTVVTALTHVLVNPAAPSVVKVFTVVPSGTYGIGFVLTIVVRYSKAVTVAGCPRLGFRMASNEDRYAAYQGGSGTTDLLFAYQTLPGDYVEAFDYRNTYSLTLHACDTYTPVTNPLDDAARQSHTYIRRTAQKPVLDANLTLPWVTYVETVIAPTSITGGGTYITLNGQAGTAVPLGVYTTLRGDLRYYGMGDLIDINVVFSSPVLTLPPGAFVSIQGLPRVAPFSHMLNDTVGVFLLTILPNETLVEPASVSYMNTYSFQAGRCGVVDVDTGMCAAQNLPPPATGSTSTTSSTSTSTSSSSASTSTSSSSSTARSSSSGGSNRDLLTPARLHVSPAPAFATSLQFLPDNSSTWDPAVRHTVHYEIGALVKVLVTFSEAVHVFGRPYIDLYLVTQSGNDTTTTSATTSATTTTSTTSTTATATTTAAGSSTTHAEPILVLFSAQVDPHSLVFTTTFAHYTQAGRLTCRAGTSGIRLNGGFAQIRRAANFLPLQGVELDLSNVCAVCPGGSGLFATAVTMAGWVVADDPGHVVSALSVRQSVGVTGVINTTYGMVTTVGGVDVTGAAYGVGWVGAKRVDTDRVGGAVSVAAYGTDPLEALFTAQSAPYTGMKGLYGAPPCAPAGAVGAELVGSRPVVTRVYSTLQGIFSAPEHLVLLVVFSGDVEVSGWWLLSY
jgi:hypothetical protein